MSSRSKPQSSNQDRKLIMVMGPTGSGKTTFINLVSGSTLRVGSTLESCTKEIQLANLDLGGQPVTLIDTPGFDDTVRPQAEVLKEIAKFLEITYNRKLTGVIYMHRISDNRMSGSAIENFSLFRKICGERPMKNAVIMTNMWSKVDEKTGIDREIELRREYFKSALERGATMVRNDGTVKCARAILGFLMLNQPEELHLQHQQVIEHKLVQETDAGLEFLRRLRELMGDALRRIHTESAKENPDNEEITRLQETVDMLRQEESNIQEEIASELSARIQELSQQVLGLIENTRRDLYLAHSGPSDPNPQQSSNAHPQQLPPSLRSSLPTPPRSDSSISSEADPPSSQQLHPELVPDSLSSPEIQSQDGIPDPDGPVSVRSHHSLVQQQSDSPSEPHSDPSSNPVPSSTPSTSEASPTRSTLHPSSVSSLHDHMPPQLFPEDLPPPSQTSLHPLPSSPLPTPPADNNLPSVSSFPADPSPGALSTTPSSPPPASSAISAATSPLSPSSPSPPPPTSTAPLSSPHSSRSTTPPTLPIVSDEIPPILPPLPSPPRVATPSTTHTTQTPSPPLDPPRLPQVPASRKRPADDDEKKCCGCCCVQ